MEIWDLEWTPEQGPEQTPEQGPERTPEQTPEQGPEQGPNRAQKGKNDIQSWVLIRPFSASLGPRNGREIAS